MAIETLMSRYATLNTLMEPPVTVEDNSIMFKPSKHAESVPFMFLICKMQLLCKVLTISYSLVF